MVITNVKAVNSKTEMETSAFQRPHASKKKDVNDQTLKPRGAFLTL